MSKQFIFGLILICFSACENTYVPNDEREEEIPISKDYFVLADEFRPDTLLTYLEEDGTIFYRSAQMLGKNSYRSRSYDSTLQLQASRVHSFHESKLTLDSISYNNPTFQYCKILDATSLPLIEGEETKLRYTINSSDVYIEKEITYQMNGKGSDFLFKEKERNWVRYDYKRTTVLTDSIKSSKRLHVGYMIFVEGIGLVENTYKHKFDGSTYILKSAKLLKIGNEN